MNVTFEADPFALGRMSANSSSNGRKFPRWKGAVSGCASRALRTHHAESEAAVLDARFLIRLHRDGVKFTRSRPFRCARRAHVSVGEYRRPHHASCSPGQIGAVVHSEFAQKRRNVKFDGAHRDVQFRGDLFVFAIANHRVQNLLLAGTQLRGAGGRTTLRQQFFGSSDQPLGKQSLGGHQNCEIIWFRPAGHTLHRQKAGGALDGEVQVATRGGSELCYPGTSLAENQRVRLLRLTRLHCLCLLRKHRYSLHVLPSPGFTRNWAGKVLLNWALLSNAVIGRSMRTFSKPFLCALRKSPLAVNLPESTMRVQNETTVARVAATLPKLVRFVSLYAREDYRTFQRGHIVRDR